MGGRGEQTISLNPTILSVQPKFHLSPELTLAGQAQEDRKGALVPWVAVKVQLRVEVGATWAKISKRCYWHAFLSAQRWSSNTP